MVIKAIHSFSTLDMQSLITSIRSIRIQPQNRHVIVEMWPKIVKQSKKMKAQLESESCTLGKNEAALASKSIRKRVQKQVKIEAQSSKKRKFGQT